jgi:hypothetical protein
MNLFPLSRASLLGVLSLGLVATAGCNVKDKLQDAINDQVAQAAAGAVCAQSNAPAACQQECGTDSSSAFCPAGFYCGAAGRCTADCTTATAATCGQNQTCTFNGRCAASAAGGADNNGNVCASVQIDTSRITPYVHILIDRSGSMNAPFADGLNRWDYVKKMLINYPNHGSASGGLIYENEDKIKFSLSHYTHPGGQGGCTANLPEVWTLGHQTSFYSAVLQSDYPNSGWGGNTPTGDSIDYLMTNYVSPLPNDGSPHIILLATDGEPDRCEEADDSKQATSADHISAIEVEEAISRAYTHEKNVKTYVVFVGNANNNVLKPHLQRIANLGVGKDKMLADGSSACWQVNGSNAAKCWMATDGDGLTDAFNEIVGAQISCDIALNGEIQDNDIACAQGQVTINGNQPLTCNDANGWKILNSKTIQIQGTACDALKNAASPRVDANFPCGSVAPIVI